MMFENIFCFTRLYSYYIKERVHYMTKNIVAVRMYAPLIIPE